MIEEEFSQPISGDQDIAPKDLLEHKDTSSAEREEKQLKKRSFTFYVGIGFLMIVLAFMGIFFGMYLRGQNKEPEVEVQPIPTIIQETPEATPASTIEVIKTKLNSLSQKLDSIDLTADNLLPPQLDYELETLLEDIEE